MDGKGEERREIERTTHLHPPGPTNCFCPMHRIRKITFWKHTMRPHLVHVQYPAKIIGFMAFASWFELFGGATKGWDTLFAEETG